MELSHYEKYGRAWYQKNKERNLERSRKWHRANRARAVEIVQAYVSRNKGKVTSYNRSFNQSVEGKYRLLKYRHTKRGWSDELLTLNDYRKLSLLSCFYCDAPTNGGLDRADNNLGYSLNNVVPCCELCNHMKWKLTQSNFLTHIARMHRHLNPQ